MTGGAARYVQQVAGLGVLFVMATDHEYGPHLRRLIQPLITGVGPVKSAAVTGAVLGELSAAKRLPDLVFSVGSAGSRILEHAGVYQVASVAYRDMDASPLGIAAGVTPFLGEPAVIEIAHRLAGVQAASLSTGGGIVTGPAYDQIAAEMVDMETYAVLRAAARFGVPTIGLRGISDGRAPLTGMHDWTDYLHILDEKLAKVLADFAADVAAGRFIL